MSAEAVPLVASRAGRTTIRPQAIRRLTQAVTAELAGVRASAVRAELADARGSLAVSVRTPLTLSTDARATGTLVERAALIVEAVASQLDALTGRSVGHVDVRFSAVRPPQRRGVR